MSNPYDLPPMDPSVPADPMPPAAPVAFRHTGVGIASFIISLVVGLVELASVIGAAVMVSRNPDMPSDSPITVAVGMAVCGGVLLGLVGVVLGIIGLLLPQRKRLFAILGVILNGAVLTVIAGLMILGTRAR